MKNLVLAALVLSGVAMTAQQATGGQDANSRFSALDRNGDGVIARMEWNGSAQSFDVQDWNGDGVLSGEELRTGGIQPNNGRGRGRNDVTTPTFTDWTEEGLRTLDRNRDGRVAASEWQADTETFYRVDQNRNGVLERGEFLGARTSVSPVIETDDRFAYLDVNADGRVERTEWDSNTASFNALDQNRNGVLTRLELEARRDIAQARDQFAALDVNRNNVVSIEEWGGNRRTFNQRDTNRDGVLSRREVVSAEVGAVPTAGGAQGVNASTGQSFVVDAQQRWTDTGIDLRAGDTVVFTANGTVRMSDDQGDTASPTGSIRGRQAADSPVPAESAGGLIARVGNASPIFVGARRTYRAPVAGRLYLSVNDDHLPDNSGQFRVNIAVNAR